jgi:hypothetical protein
MQKPAVTIMVKAARAAGNVLIRHMNRLDALNVVEKDRLDYASEVDGLAEEAIVRELKKAMPECAILGAAGWMMATTALPFRSLSHLALTHSARLSSSTMPAFTKASLTGLIMLSMSRARFDRQFRCAAMAREYGPTNFPGRCAAISQSAALRHAVY